MKNIRMFWEIKFEPINLLYKSNLNDESGKLWINKFIKIDDTEIEEYKFHQQKNLALINNLDINKIVVSFKFLFGKQDFKYFISYKDFEKIGHLCIFCPLMVMCKRSFDENRRI